MNLVSAHRAERKAGAPRARVRELFVDSLVAQDGLLHAAGSGVWTDTRSDKRRPFVQNDLTHFIDGQVEILASTRGACCGAAKRKASAGTAPCAHGSPWEAY